MARTFRSTLAMVSCGLLAAQLALAQSATTTGQTKGQSTADASMQPVQATTNTNAEANATAELDARKAREAIEKKAEKVSAQAKAKAETQLGATVDQVNKGASVDGDVTVATRLAAEFGMTPEALSAEKQSLDVSWGQLMIAHTLAANSKTTVTVEQLVALNKDGMGWGKIAAGLGLQLGSVVSSVNAESRVAHGLDKADGHVAAMRGEGARLGGNAGANAGLGVQAGKANVNAGAGLGLKINH
ncbi:MAG TPA: hypothetical protein VI504_06110 [Candidatus Eisenbacteria bacterium]|jgi:hypothetical protein